MFDGVFTGTVCPAISPDPITRVGLAALTVTTAYLYGGGTTTDEAGVVTWTNPVQFYECSPAGGDPTAAATATHAVNFGRHRKITVADI